MPRSQSYIDTYARQAAAAKRWDEIVARIENEDELALELQGLISDEYDTIANLEETLRVKASPFDTAAKILQDKVAGETAAAVAKKKAAKLPPALETTRDAQTFATTMTGLKSVSAEQIALIKAKAREIGVSQPIIDTFDRRVLSGAIATEKPVVAKGGVTPEQAQVISILAQQGEQGYRGGTEGRAFREGLSSEQRIALDEYLRFIGQGTVPPADHPGAAVYEAVASKGAYQNKDARLFNATWVALRQRINSLEARAEATDPTKLREGRTPEQEAMYRELRARGIDPDDPALSLKGTPAYDVVTRARQLPLTRDGLPMGGTGPAYTSARNYVELARKSGQKPSITALLDQLRKVTANDKEAVEVAAWAVAWDAASQNPPKSAEERKAELKAEYDAKKEETKTIKDEVKATEDAAKAADQQARAEAQVAAAEEQPKAVAPAPAPPPVKTFRDPTDRNSPVYTRTETGFEFTNKAGKVTSVPFASKAGFALALAEQGDVEAIKRLQALQQSSDGGGQKSDGSSGGPAPAPVSELEQLQQFIRSGTIPSGTAQYEAAKRRIAELQGTAPAPTPAPPPAPPPAPNKPIEQMTNEELQALIGGQ